MNLKGSNVLVTGAGTGIGEAIAVAMADAGADVIAADIDVAAASRTADTVTTKSVRGFSVQADCGDVTSINAMVDTTVAKFGKLDVIVNNAGVTRSAFIMDLTEEDWDRIHRVNAKGVFFCLQRAAKQMMQQDGGRIINMASIAGRGFKDTSNAAYAASKGAVISMTRTTAQQLGRHNINFNAICPGVTMTPLVETMLVDLAKRKNKTEEEALADISRPIPIGRANTPEDIAALAVFLASPGARNITGQAYNVDGGLITS